MPTHKTTIPVVLKALKVNGPMTMKDIAKSTGMSRRTIYHVIQELLDDGAIRRRLTFDDTRLHLYEVTEDYEQQRAPLGQR